MAVIECPECKKMISSRAVVCPNCGNPNNAVEAQPHGERSKEHRKRWAAFVLVGGGLILLAVVGYIAFGPFITVHEIKSGLEDQDSGRLAAYVDFPRLRANLKAQLNAIVMRQAATESRENPFGAPGMALGSKLVDSMIDSFVIPSGLKNLAAGQAVPAEQTADSESSNHTSAREHTPQLFHEARYRYDSLSNFSVWVGSRGPDQVRFVLSREGLLWKLTNIVVPVALTGATARATPESKISGCRGKFRFPKGGENFLIGAAQTIDWEMPDGDTYYDVQLELLTDRGDLLGSVIDWNWVKYDPIHTADWDARTVYSWNPQGLPSQLDVQLKPGIYKLRLSYKYADAQDHRGACPLGGEFESNSFVLSSGFAHVSVLGFRGGESAYEMGERAADMRFRLINCDQRRSGGCAAGAQGSGRAAQEMRRNWAITSWLK
jgi:Protein of unknown function (DUF2939)/zinc-ribbon domain